MARRFHSLTSYADIMPFDLDSFESSVKTFIGTDNTVVLVAGDEGEDVTHGMAAAIVYPSWWNHAHLTGQELFWWVDESKRGGKAAIELFNGLERWADKKGVKSFSMISTPNLTPDSLKKLYERRGYKQWDNFYTKEM
jgi:hypothetical protein